MYKPKLYIMKNLTFLVLFTFIIPTTLFSQGCLPDGITFTTQTQIDNFQTNFPGCSVIEGDVKINGDDITNLNGLIVLDSINGELEIENTLLENLEGLNNLIKIGENGWDWLTIKHNDSLYNFEGLESLVSIEGNLTVQLNPNLFNFSGLESLTSIGDSYLSMGDLEIGWNSALTSLSGLENLVSIEEDLRIGVDFYGERAPNPNLTDISALENLTYIGDALIIGNNESLTSLVGLENLSYVTGVGIHNNNSLTSLDGLDDIDAASIEGLMIYFNPSLSTCAVQSICDYLVAPYAFIDIHDNAPGCNSQQEVEDACEAVDINENYFKYEFLINPNPASNDIFIESKNGTNIIEINIYNPVGQLVQKEKQFNNSINISTLHQGIYVIEIVTDKIKIRKKLIIR